MKKRTIAILLLLACSLIGLAKQPEELPGLKTLFDKYGVTGAILLFDQNGKTYKGYNLDRCNTGCIPASTFKIANTLIALETGVATTDTVFRWSGEPRSLKVWEADMTLAQAFRVSNVSVYQAIAKSIGVERMSNYIRLLHYGDMDIKPENISTFWLEGDSKITLYQQIYFLRQLYNLEFPLSERAMEATKRIMLLEETDSYKLSAKTGRAIREGRDIGWFVGYVETAGNVWFFATNIDPLENKNESNFGQIRIDLTKDIIKQLGIIE